MKIKFIIICLFISTSIFSQELESNKIDTVNSSLYPYSINLLSEIPIASNIRVIPKSDDGNQLIVKKFLDGNTGELYTKLFDIWALKYKGEYYFHLYHAPHFQKVKFFSKLQVIGKYCAFVIDDSFSVYFFGVGWLSLANGWLQKNGEYHIIYFVDTEKSKNAKVLDKERLKNLFPNDYKLHNKIDKNELHLEDVLELINQLNQK
jgi:hypothetical protein